MCWKFWIILTHQSYRRNNRCPGEVAAIVIHNKHCQRAVQEKDETGVGGRQVGGGGEGTNEEPGGGGWLPRYIPHLVQGTALGTGQITAPLQVEGFSKRREVQFKFLKLTLDGVRLSQEEVRFERKS